MVPERRRGHHGPGPFAPGLGRDRSRRGDPQRRRAGPAGRRRPSCARWSRRTATGTADRPSPAPHWPAGPRAWPWRWSTRASSSASTTWTRPILLLSECGLDAVETAIAYGLTPTVYSPRRSRPSPPRPGHPGGPIAVHVKVDTGMHRVGAAPEDLPAVVAAVRREPRSSSKACGRTCRWPTALGARTGPSPRPSSTCSTVWWPLGTRAWRSRCCTRPTRPAPSPSPAPATAWSVADSALYGYLPGPSVHAAFAEQAGGDTLQPAMSLKAQVVAVRTLDAGERPSYGRLRPLPERSVVATVPIGYADGVPRALFGAGYEVLIGGRAAAAGRHGDHGSDRGRLRRPMTRCAPATRSCCSAARETRRSRPTIGRTCWARSATRWYAGSARACPASWSTDPMRPGD